MEGRYLFLKWVMFAILLVLGTIIMFSLGWFRNVLSGDPTRLSTVNLFVFVFTTAWCGWLSWKASAGADATLIAHQLNTGWFIANVHVVLGIIGTALGFFIMLRHSGDGADAGQQMAKQIQLGMATVLINTIVGGICNLLIEIQSHFIGQEVTRPAAGSGKAKP